MFSAITRLPNIVNRLNVRQETYIPQKKRVAKVVLIFEITNKF
jgi:hypothetical protein